MDCGIEFLSKLLHESTKFFWVFVVKYHCICNSIHRKHLKVISISVLHNHRGSIKFLRETTALFQTYSHIHSVKSQKSDGLASIYVKQNETKIKHHRNIVCTLIIINLTLVMIIITILLPSSSSS